MKSKSYSMLGVFIVLSVALFGCSAPTTTSTKVPTQAPSEAPTKAPTEMPTKASTQELTKTPTETPTEAPVEYGQINIWHKNKPEFYLTYDPAKWEAKGGEYEVSLDSNLYPGCSISSFYFRDGPDMASHYTYDSQTQILAGTEFLLDLEIPKSTGVPDLIHVYWDNYQYELTLVLYTENYDECLAAFWEVMELSIANNFGQ